MHTILRPEDFIFWVVTGKIHAQMKPEEDQMQNEIIEQSRRTAASPALNHFQSHYVVR